MCAFDNKRFLLDDGISSLAYGHHNITNKVTVDEVENPTASLTLTHSQAAEKRLRGFNYYPPMARITEESEEAAVEEGKALNENAIGPLAAVTDCGQVEVIQESRHVGSHESNADESSIFDSEDESDSDCEAGFDAAEVDESIAGKKVSDNEPLRKWNRKRGPSDEIADAPMGKLLIAESHT